MVVNYWYKKGPELLKEIKNTIIPDNSIAIWFLGQESLIIKNKDMILYIDPYFSEPLDKQGNPKRKFGPPYKANEIDHADIVLCTHNHSDHLDPEALKDISTCSTNARFIVPAPNTGVLSGRGIPDEKIIGARAGSPIVVSQSITITPVQAAHEDYVVDEQGNHLFLGYVMDLGGIKIFHSGDCVEMPDTVELLQPFNIDVMCLPINGSDWKRKRHDLLGNMNAREAANVAAECSVDLVIPMHFDLFPHNSENPAHFADYMQHYYPASKYHIMVPGERFIYMK